MKVELTIFGRPKGKGRPKFSRRGGFFRAYTPKETEDYEENLRSIYRRDYGREVIFAEKPIKVKIDAYFKIPVNTSKKKAKELEGKPYDKKPDVDNIGKIVLDALNEVAFHDDDQVTTIEINKWYTTGEELECVKIEIEEVIYMDQICSNCDFYPFCEKCDKPTGTCENWKKEGLVKWEK